MSTNCDPTCTVNAGFYTYDPSIGGNAVLLAAYVLLLPAVFYPDIRFYRHAFSVTLLAGLALDIAGFVGRLLLHDSPGRENLFALSLIGTTLGPTFITGAIILTLPHTLGLCSEQVSSRKRSIAAVLLFISIVGTAILELVGVVCLSFDLGGIGRSGGADFIAGGLGLQVLALLGFIGLHFWFIVIFIIMNRSVVDTRSAAVYRTSRFRHFVFGTGAASLLLLAYSIYRIIEMAQGLRGQLFQNQNAFMIVNGALPVVAAALVAVFQPARSFDTGRQGGITSPSSVSLRPIPFAQEEQPVPGPRERQMEERGRPWPYPYEPDIGKQLPSPLPSPLPPAAVAVAAASHHRRPSQQNVKPMRVADGSISNLPPNPKPLHQRTRTFSPSPNRGRVMADRGPSRLSGRSEPREPAELVEHDSLW